MIIKVKRNLNIRRRPDTAADRVGIVLAGKEIEVASSVSGENIDGNLTWYVDDKNNYYWSGGTEVVQPGLRPAPIQPPFSIPVQPVVPKDFANIFVDYQSILKDANAAFAAKIQPTVEQDKIIVVVMDSGIYEAHPDFGNAFRSGIVSQNFSSSPTEKDIFGHGTHVAGLIGSRTDDKPGIIGAAPRCILRNLKVIDDRGNTEGDGLLKALQTLNNKNVHILNLSLDVIKTDYDKIESELKRISAFATIVASAGNDDSLVGKFILMPAFAPFVISVGAVGAEFYQQNAAPDFSPRLDFIFPKWSLMSCSTKDNAFYKEDLGCSMATALVSGMIAAMITAGGDLSHKTIRDELKNIAQPYPSKPDYNKLTLLKPL